MEPRIGEVVCNDGSAYEGEHTWLQGEYGLLIDAFDLPRMDVLVCLGMAGRLGQ